MELEEKEKEEQHKNQKEITFLISPIKQTQKKRKIVAFDFDKTLSVIHLYQFLSEKHAQTEVTQLFTINELNGNNSRQFSENVVFGGFKRINLLASYFENIIKNNSDIIVVTKGYVGSCTKTLLDVNLLQYISMIYGNIESYYTYGSENNEKLQIKMLKDKYKDYLGNQFQNLDNFKQIKDQLLEDIRVKQGLSKDDIILIDDDISMIKGMQNQGMAGMHIDGGKGIIERHLQEIFKWVQM